MIPNLSFLPPVIAHRGAGQNAPENTLSAIHRAYEEGARWVEFDVKITYDGVPILMHDDTLDRTTNVRGPVADAMWEDIQLCDAGIRHNIDFAGERVPHLAEALDVVIEHGLSAIIEIKPCPGRAKATTMVSMIEIAKVWPESEIFPVISSFDMECLEVAAQLEPPWPRCVLMRDWKDEWFHKVGQAQACAISFRAEHLTRERVRQVLDSGIAILAYSVINPAQAKELLAWGVSAVYSCAPRMILDDL